MTCIWYFITNRVYSYCQQVLVSIQGLILIKDPMFNEPSYEKIQGTKEGDVSSLVMPLHIDLLAVPTGKEY